MAPIVAQLSAILLWLAKSEQWGITRSQGDYDTWTEQFPIQMSKVYVCSLTRHAEDGAPYIVRIKNLYPDRFDWSDSDTNGHHGWGNNNFFIAVGSN